MKLFLATVLILAFAATAQAHAFPESPVKVAYFDVCMNQTSQESCEDATEPSGDACVWCESKAVPSRCLNATFAKRLPPGAFNCLSKEEPKALELTFRPELVKPVKPLSLVFRPELVKPAEPLSLVFRPELIKPIKPLSLVFRPELMKNVGSDWKYCKGASKGFEVSSVDTVVGADIAMTIEGTLASEVTSGNVSAKLKLYGIEVFSGESPLGDGSSLPAGPGSFTYAQKVEIPDGTPKGDYTSELTFSDQDGNDLTCVSIPFTI